MSEKRYPPISDYAFISDCHSSALVSLDGSIDWCCMPRFDSASCFGRLLGWENGGFCRIAPSLPFTTSRRYMEESLILETTFKTSSGEARLLDCLTMKEGGSHHPHRQILRIVEGVSGSVEFTIDIEPRFDYGIVKPWISRNKKGKAYVIGGNDGLLVTCEAPLAIEERHTLRGSCVVHAGERKRMSILWRKPEELDRRFDETTAWWRSWSARCTYNGPFADHVRRSALVLKGLTNAPTGAIAAAPTTSLPESPGGSRNWDYRFSWIRDSCFTVRSLVELGYAKEADGFRRFIERSAAGSAEQLQILYGLGGERRLQELELDNLEGYRGARPVRIGNAAEHQTQLDMYGEVLDLSWRWHQLGNSPDDEYWEFLVDTVRRSASEWNKADRGIWEMRGKPRHFVQSKAMCWAALDRGISLARALGRDAPLKEWERTRDQIRNAIEERGFDRKRGVFTQAFGYPAMDASLLLIPSVGFVDYNDERMIRTTAAVREELDSGGLLLRYPVGNDDLKGEEGVFIACTFWLAECLARQGKKGEAEEVFRKAVATANDLLLFAEEFDPRTGEMLGNYPQGLTHLSLITAAVALRDGSDRS